MKMKWMKAVVVLAVFLGTYALKDFTQFADNVYAGGAGHDHPAAPEGKRVGKVEIVEPSSTPEAKPVNKDEEIKEYKVVGDTATVTCGKDTPDSKIEELAAQLEAAGVVKLIVKREGGKKASEKGKKKQDEENYLLSEADEDDFILADAWDEVLAMLRKHPVFAKSYEDPEISDALAERIDDRIENQVEKFVDAYMETWLKRLSNARAVNLFEDEEESDAYFDWKEQKAFIKDMDEKLTEEFNALVEKEETEGLTKDEQIRQRRLHLQIHTLDKLKKSFNRAVKEAEEVIRINSGQGTPEGDMFDPSMGFPGMPGMEGMDPFGGFTQKPQTGWGLNIGSTPWGGVTFGVDRNGENGDWGISGGYEHAPQKYLEMFGPMGMGGGFGGGGFGGFNPGAMAGNPFANPMDFMGSGGGFGGR